MFNLRGVHQSMPKYSLIQYSILLINVCINFSNVCKGLWGPFSWFISEIEPNYAVYFKIHISLYLYLLLMTHNYGLIHFE